MHSSPLSPSVVLTIYGILILLASLAGGGLPAFFRLTHARLQAAVSFVAGLMLGLALLHMLPHGVEALGSVGKGAGWLLAGFLVMFLLQRFLPFHHHDVGENHPHADGDLSHDHDHGHDDDAPISTHLGWLSVAVGLSLHSIFDGLALAAAVASDVHRGTGGLGLGTALVVILHKPFGAMAITTLMSASHSPRHWQRLVNIGFALVTPLGALLFFLGAGHLAHESPQWLGAALTFSAGTFLCIACADLLPELQFHSHDRIKLSVALLAGVGVAMLIGVFGHPEHEHEQSHQELGALLTGSRLALLDSSGCHELSVLHFEESRLESGAEAIALKTLPRSPKLPCNARQRLECARFTAALAARSCRSLICPRCNHPKRPFA